MPELTPEAIARLRELEAATHNPHANMLDRLDAESVFVALLRTHAPALLDAAGERERLKAEVETDDRLIADRDRILDRLPCPTHGRCIPHVLEQIDALQARVAALEKLLRRVVSPRDSPLGEEIRVALAAGRGGPV